MKNIEIVVSIEFKETEAETTSSTAGEKEGKGRFRLVLDGKSSMDIDRLEQGLLGTTYPALRDALSEHLEKESKKKP